MKPPIQSIAYALTLTALAASPLACGGEQKKSETPDVLDNDGPAEDAGEELDEAADDTKDAAEDAADDAEDAVDNE